LHALDITSPQAGFTLIGVLLLMLLAAMAFSGVTAVLLERIAYRPLRRRGGSRLAALISAIGASFFLQELFAQKPLFGNKHLLLGRNDHFLHNLLTKTKLFEFEGATISADKVVVV